MTRCKIWMLAAAYIGGAGFVTALGGSRLLFIATLIQITGFSTVLSLAWTWPRFNSNAEAQFPNEER